MVCSGAALVVILMLIHCSWPFLRHFGPCSTGMIMWVKISTKNYWTTIFLKPRKKIWAPGSDSFLINGSESSEIGWKKDKKHVLIALESENFPLFPNDATIIKSCPKIIIFFLALQITYWCTVMYFCCTWPSEVVPLPWLRGQIQKCKKKRSVSYP